MRQLHPKTRECDYDHQCDDDPELIAEIRTLDQWVKERDVEISRLNEAVHAAFDAGYYAGIRRAAHILEVYPDGPSTAGARHAYKKWRKAYEGGSQGKSTPSSGSGNRPSE